MTTTTTPALTSPAQVAKAITYIALTVAAVYEQAQGQLTAPVIIAMTIAGLGAIPVFLKAGTVAKTIIAFATAVLQALVLVLPSVFTGHDILNLSPHIWVGLIISGLAAIGIAVVPNKPLTAVPVATTVLLASPETTLASPEPITKHAAI